MDFFDQGISLGRWFRINVILHWMFILYAAHRLILGRHPDSPIGPQVLWFVLLFATVLLHEFGHALSCRAVGGTADKIVLWPLGGLAFVQPPMTPYATLVTTVCGPLVNAILWPMFWAINTFALPYLMTSDVSVGSMYVIYGCYMMEEINRLLLLFNLIPAYPMDGGRILQEVLWFFIGYPRSLMIAGMVGTVAGAGFVVLGLGLHSITIPWVNFTLGAKGHVELMLVVIGLMCAMASWGIYQQSQTIRDWRKR
jgi:Zn-dependent protease